MFRFWQEPDDIATKAKKFLETGNIDYYNDIYIEKLRGFITLDSISAEIDKAIENAQTARSRNLGIAFVAGTGIMHFLLLTMPGASEETQQNAVFMQQNEPIKFAALNIVFSLFGGITTFLTASISSIICCNKFDDRIEKLKSLVPEQPKAHDTLKTRP